MRALKIFDVKLLKFILVGLCNTLISAALMFLLYNLAGLGYWGSSAISYIAGAVVSFFLNKNFTFRSGASLLPAALKFALNVAVCYFIAFSAAKPIANALLGQLDISVTLREQAAMLGGMVLYTALNYFGQRFIVFKKQDDADGK